MKKSVAILLILFPLFWACNKNGTYEVPDRLSDLVINEVAAHENLDADTWVEILNTSDSSRDLDGVGLYVYDKYFNGKQIYNGKGSLAADERIVISTADESLVTGLAGNAPFKLILGESRGKAIDTFDWVAEGDSTDVCLSGSYQRIPDGSDTWRNLTYASPKKSNKVFDLADYQNNAIWVWSTHVKDFMADDAKVLKEMKAKGYDHILLNFAAFEPTAAKATRRFIATAYNLDMVVHAWVQCFHLHGKWISPIDDVNHCYNQEHFDVIIAKCKKYIEEFGIRALHLDYIRCGGKAYIHDPHGAFGINEFCHQLREFVDSYDENIILSAAMMAEDNGEYYYGQNPGKMSAYIDIFMPMLYRHNAVRTWSEEHSINMAKLFIGKGDSQCWAGITTYNYPSGKIIGMSAEEIKADADLFKNNCDVSGLVLFRYGYGEFPDMNNYWN